MLMTFGSINSNLTAEVSKKTNTSDLPYGFRNIFTSLWTETAGGPDDADFGLIVRTPPAGYSGDTAYYFTFYEGGNGNKSYGIQICFSRQGAFVPMYRAKQGGKWSGWVAI